MHRIDTSTAQVDKFGSGKNGFTGGNPQTGVLPTALDADYFDTLQEELAGVIEAAGITLNKANNAQLTAAIKALVGPGRLLGPPQVFTSSGTYTPTAGTKKIIVEVLGAGGGGGGARAVSSGNASTAGGGGGGGYAKSLITSVPSSAVVTVGVGGAAGTWQSGGTATTGSAGGNSSFGSLLSATGGGGGGSSLTGQYTTPIHITGGLPGAGSNGNILNSLGWGGLPGFIFTASNATGGGGGSSVYSGGYNNENRETGIAGVLGSGGTGCSVVNNSSAQAVGGKGGNGIVIVWEYA